MNVNNKKGGISMHWSCWVKCQLRKYLCKELIRRDLIQKLKYVDNDVQMSSMRLSGMPRSNSLPSSIVERQAERREVIREKVQNELDGLNKTCEHIERALQTLDPIEQTVIKSSYFSVRYEDSELAAYMGMNVQQLENIRNVALGSIYNYLSWQPLRDKRMVPERSRAEESLALVL
jgi:hypothetical protein